jgi:Transposase
MHAPNAAILFDKFHVMRHLGEALDHVRKSEYGRLAGRDRRYIKGQKYTLLSRKENLTLDGRKTLKTLLSANKRLNTAYVSYSRCHCRNLARGASGHAARRAYYSDPFSKALRIMPMARPTNSFSVEEDLLGSGTVSSPWGTGTSSTTILDDKPVSGSSPDLETNGECSTRFSGCGAVAVRGGTSFGSLMQRYPFPNPALRCM